MAPQLPEGLSVSSLIGAKGAELKFWSVKTNELAERKVLNISGTNEVLRGNLATYYGLDLTVNPRTATITTPTISEDIRDQWKEKVKAGIPFKLLTQDKQPESQQSPFPHPIVSTNSEIQASQTQTTATPSIQISSSKAAVASTAASVQREFSLERCEGLPAIIQQIESGAVQAIRDRYGPSKPGQRGTADASWPKYSNLVSKRERLHRILTQDFEGDKGRFLAYFSIVEALPWCEADLTAERRKEQYLDEDGKFPEALWSNRWKTMNGWEVWREIGRERYTKEK